MKEVGKGRGMGERRNGKREGPKSREQKLFNRRTRNFFFFFFLGGGGGGGRGVCSCFGLVFVRLVS